MTDAQGIPLAVTLTGANVHDVKAALPTLCAIPAIHGRRGRPRHTPRRVTGDKAYDSEPLRQTLRRLGIHPEFPKRRRKDHLGRHRWVVERTISWLNRFRRCGFVTNDCPVFTWRFSNWAARSSAGMRSPDGFEMRSEEDDNETIRRARVYAR